VLHLLVSLLAACLAAWLQAYFKDGDPCPGDLPKRSFTVNLVCDDKEHMYGGEEPSTCVYHATLATPLACKEEALVKVGGSRVLLSTQEA